MKTQINKELLIRSRLKSYLALTAGFVAFSPLADAQIIYTDVNPDSVLTGNDSLLLDINHDGTFDFKVNQHKFKQGNSYRYDNHFIGLYGNQVLSASGWTYSSQRFYAPKPMNLGDDMISNPPKSVWKNGGRLGFFQALQDKYVGFRFKINSDFFYGWARFDVENYFKSITIKDYAYNSESGKILKAGVTKVSLPDENPLKNVLVYATAGSIRIEAPTDQKLTGNIRLTDINGRELSSVDVKNKININLNTQDLATGVYIVNIITEKGILNKRVLIR